MDDKIKLVKYLAELGMMNFSDEELKTMVEDVKDIIKLIDQIKEADTTGLKTLKSQVEFNNLRKDKARPSMDKQELLKNAVKKESGSFSVVKVVE